MKKFVKTLPKRHPLSVEIRELHGAEGFTYLTDLLDLAQEIGFFELTPKIVSRECGINAQKVARIFENLKRIFEESCEFLELSSNKVPTKLEESSKKVETLEGQNPRGSTRDQEKNREEKKEYLPRPKPLRVTDEQIETAKWIFEQIRAMNPSQKEPNFQGWANDVRLMVEQDGRTLEAIKELFSWVTKDPFWRTNVLSPAKLREKWDMLTLKKQNPRPNYAQKSKGTYLPGNQIIPADQRKEMSLSGADLKAELARIRAENGGGNV